jgi:disulfide bond formation protein DsbB
MTTRQLDVTSPTGGPSVKVALTALTTFQGYVQQADEKANVMVVVHTGGVVAVVTAVGGTAGAQWSPVLGILLLGFTVAFLVSGFHIMRALRPSTHAPAVANPFGVTGLDAVPAVDPWTQAEQLWAMARFLGGIALAKNRALARATPWTALVFCLGVASAVLS